VNRWLASTSCSSTARLASLVDGAAQLVADHNAVGAAFEGVAPTLQGLDFGVTGARQVGSDHVAGGHQSCSNAIVTSRKLPAVLVFLDHLQAQREEMSLEAWAGCTAPPGNGSSPRFCRRSPPTS
jgi:hypothetical protein